MKKQNRPVARLLAVIMASLLALAPFTTVYGQQAATATIEGVITDPNGAVVPQAKVTAKNTETGFTREISTDDSGVYRLPLLPPGTYDLTVTAANFAELKRSTIRLQVGQKLNLDLTLSVTASAESVNITAEAPIVETSRPSVSSSVNERAVRDLPVNGRNFLDFVTLTPGVVRDPNRAGDLSFGGQRGTFNSLQIDGVDNNNLFFGQSLGRTGSGRAPYQFSQDAVKEFQVNTNSYSAEFGRAAGGSINVITKSGTNEFHGTAFEFYRDRALNARALRTVRSTSTFLVPVDPKQAYHFNQFGGNVGGPIKRDRAFFFFDYDGQRNTLPNPVNLGVAAPSDAASQAGLAKLLPFVTGYTQGFNQNVYLAKGDIQLDAANRLTLRYNRQNFTGVNLESSGPQIAQEHSGNSLVTTDTFSVTLNTAFSSRLLNEFRTQVARDKEPGLANSDNPEAVIRQGGINVFTIGRNNFSPRETAERKYQFIDNVSYLAGKHSLKGGVDFNIEKIRNFFPGLFGGVYTFDTYADFANNKPSRFTQSFAGTGTTGATTFPNANEYGLFLQDDWRATPRLTLNLGVRYDLQLMKQPGVRNPSPALAAAGIDTSRVNNDHNNVAPRFGFAWKPTGSDRFVTRGGYGLFYGRTPSIMLGTAHSQNGLNVININLGNPTLPFTYPGRFADLAQASGFAPATPSLYVFERNYQQPYTQQGSLGFEFGVTKDISFSATYLYVKGTHLQRTRDINLLPPVLVSTAAASPVAATFLRHPGPQGNPTRPIAGFGNIREFESNANSTYNGLALQLNKRFSQNFQVLLAYTWSRVIDDNPDATSVVAGTDDVKNPQQTFFLSDERGPGGANIPHRFVASGVWDLGYFHGLSGPARVVLDGWQLSGILQANSNPPFSAKLGVDLNNDTATATDRAPSYGRNSFRQGRFVKFDFRLAKSFYLRENVRVQFIGEFFNLFNRVNFTGFNNTLYTVGGLTAGSLNPSVTLTPRTDFLLPSAAAVDGQRIGQLALKFIF